MFGRKRIDPQVQAPPEAALLDISVSATADTVPATSVPEQATLIPESSAVTNPPVRSPVVPRAAVPIPTKPATATTRVQLGGGTAPRREATSNNTAPRTTGLGSSASGAMDYGRTIVRSDYYVKARQFVFAS